MSFSQKITILAKAYDKMNDNVKKDFINRAYHKERASYREIGSLTGKYANKIRRDAIRLGVKSRSKSEAQAIALDTGRHVHPTKGVKRSDDVKLRISESRAQAWEDLSPEERERLSELGKQQWAKMTDAEKKALQEAAGKAIRKAAKEGSKLEKFLHEKLIQAGYRVEYHKVHAVKNERLHLDMVLTGKNIAIEIDGPSHFSPIWGQEAFARNQKADNQKSGLLLSQGMVLIRVQQRKSLSQIYQRNILKELLETLEKIEAKFPESGDRYIVLGV